MYVVGFITSGRPYGAVLRGLETLALQVEHANSLAQQIAEFLQSHPAVRWVRYPDLPSHPQYDLAKQRAFELDEVRLIDIPSNLGDAKSLVAHPATTTHKAMGPEGRAAIGLENTEDLIADLDLELG